MYKLLCKDVFISLGYISGSRIAGSHGNSVFSILQNYQIVFEHFLTLKPLSYLGVRWSVLVRVSKMILGTFKHFFSVIC